MLLITTKDRLRLLAGLFMLHIGVVAIGQTTINFQGFETATPCNNWGFTGGVVTTETRRTGTYAARIGRDTESNMITFNTVYVTGLSGLQLRFHHAVRSGAGPGMDTNEGAVVQVQINGGAWNTVQVVSGFGDFTWAWTNVTGGNPGNGCGSTMPNPVTYAPPGGTNTIAFRIFATRGSCPSGSSSPLSYDRTDEGLFIDDVTLTTTTTPLPYVWSGAVDTDWHKCNNWRYGVVPGLTSAVLIDGTAANHCEVYTANAQCASLDVLASTATVRNLTIRTGRQLSVTNGITVTRTGAGVPVGITLGTSGTGTLSCASISLSGSALANKTAYLRNEAGANGLLVRGDLLVDAGGHLDLEGAGVGGILQLQGDLINNDGEAAFDEQYSLVWFSGALPQSVTTNGFEERFGSIRMGKSADDLTLNAPISIRAALILTYTATPGGRIRSSATNLLTSESTGTNTGASNTSYVDGPVRKFGTANCIYPIGKLGVYRPAQTTNVAGTAADAFTAEYFPLSARTTFSPLVEPTLSHVSDCEYWTIDRSVGSADARVTLSWHDTYSCGVTVPAELRVAWFDAAGPIWRDRGNNGATTTAWGGWVPSAAVQTTFGHYTLASTTGNNPLPISLLFFDAQADGERVRCDWTTLSERNNAYFEVERSADGWNFQPIGRVEGAGNSWTALNYDLYDPRPLSGTSYYRLRQTDHDGASTLSHAVPVHFERTHTPVTVLYDVDALRVQHGMALGSRFALFDARGKLVLDGTLTQDPFSLNSTQAVPAMYMLLLQDGSREERVKVIF